MIYNKAWEPSVAQCPLNLDSQNHTKNIPLVIPSSPNKIWGNSVQGFLSYDLTNKQILHLYIYRFIDI